MEKEETLPKLAIHEVIVVGKPKLDYKNETGKSIANMFEKKFRTGEDGLRGPLKMEVKKEIMARFRFSRESELNEEAKEKGLTSNYFFHIRVTGIGNSAMKDAAGTRKISNALNKPGYSSCFKNQYPTTFNEIKEELTNYDFELVGEDPDCGEIRLHQYGLVGCWDIFPMGFEFYSHQRNPKTGVMEELMGTKRLDNGLYKIEKSKSTLGRHFVYESEYNTIGQLRDKIRKANMKYRIITETNDDPNRNDAGASEPAANTVTTKEEETI